MDTNPTRSRADGKNRRLKDGLADTIAQRGGLRKKQGDEKAPPIFRGNKHKKGD